MAGILAANAIADGWLRGARRVISPNFDARPAGSEITLVVIHGISLPPGEYGGPWVERLFTNSLPTAVHPYFREVADARVSAHLFIRRDGSVVQFVPFDARAWHAGVSEWRGRSACNDYAIGIELEGCDTTPYAAAQYTRLTQVLATLRAAYPAISDDAVVGHCHVAPGRKTDPGDSFDWARLKPARLPEP